MITMNEETLDFSSNDFKQLLDRSSEFVLNQFNTIQTQKGYHDYPQKEVEGWFDEELPEEGMEPRALLDEVETKVLNTATGNLGPHMYAYVMSGGNQMALGSSNE